MPKYLILNNHPAIIDKQTFKEVQREIARRSGKIKVSSTSLTSLGKYSGKYALTDILVCGCCGSPYKRKTWKLKGVNEKVRRCLSRVEHGKKYCNKSITLKEELQQSICKAISQTIEHQDEFIAIMMSNLESVITGKDANTDIYAIQHQITELNRLRDVTINTRMNTNGDKSRYNSEIINLTKQIEHLREQLEIEKEKVTMNEVLNVEVERIENILADYKNHVLQYDELMVRTLIERIRVMPDKTLELILKGRMVIEQKI